MPRFPTILVIGSQAMSTSLPASGFTLSRTAISSPLFDPQWPADRQLPQRGLYPDVSSGRLCRHLVSLFISLLVIPRSLRIIGPYIPASADERPPPGGA